MDLSRRAKPVAPLAESRRSSDFFRPVTTAGYSAAIPLVVGQQRVPTTIIRDGRKKAAYGESEADGRILYGLSSGPLASVRRMYADQGQVTDLGATPEQFAHLAGGTLPYVHSEDVTDKDVAAPSRSFEVSSDYTLAGANAAWISGTEADDTGASGTNGQPLQCSDFGGCVTGAGSSAREYLVVWSQTERTFELFSRAAGADWAQAAILASASVRSDLLPGSTGTPVPQPRVAAVGNIVHVVWNRNTIVSGLPSSDSLATGQIIHLWSADAGATWTVGQPLSMPANKLGFGVKRLGLSVHSSGEVWAWAQRQTAWQPPAYDDAVVGPVVGFLPANATSATAWIVPTSTSASGLPGAAGEMCVVDTAPPDWRDKRSIIRAPSVLPLGGGQALLACVWIGYADLQEAQLRVVRIRATTVVRWDLPDAQLLHSNVVSLSALNAAGFGERVLGFKAGAAGAGDSILDPALGRTQIVATGASTWAVLVNNYPAAVPPNMDASAAPPYYYEDERPWGAWRIWWGSGGVSGAVVWESTPTDLSTTSAPGFGARLFANGNGQIWAAFGKPPATVGGAYPKSYLAPEWHLWMLATTGGHAATQLLDYVPSTALNNSVGYQVIPLNGTALLIMRENEDGDSHITCGVREIYVSPATGDVLPSVIVRRLLKDPRGERGLNLRHLEFDDETWEIFDNYCLAMGIKFSLLRTEQEAAWPLAYNIIESANAYPYRSEGKLKVFVRETATITGTAATYTPKPEHAGPCMTIPAADLRDGITIETTAIDEKWNALTVNWKDRSRNYSDSSYPIVYESGRSRLGEIAASACNWPWITEAQVAATCAWLRLRRAQICSRTYAFAISQRYMLLEVGDIVTVSDASLPECPVRILKIAEAAGGWREITAEDVRVATRAISPPINPGETSGGGSVVVVTPVNLPILFVALIGGILQIWALLSGPPGWRGCEVQASWDGTTWDTIGSCSTPSPTGWLTQDMTVLRPRLGQRPHPGLRPGAADYLLADFAEGTALPPMPAWSAFQAGDEGALLWVDGELLAYAAEVDDGAEAQCGVFRRALYGTALGMHARGARVGAVTSSAFRWPVPSGRSGSTCYLRFPSYGEVASRVPAYPVEIPA